MAWTGINSSPRLVPPLRLELGERTTPFSVEILSQKTPGSEEPVKTKTLLATSFALIVPVVFGLGALAQSPSALDILAKLEATQKSIKDYRARVAGTAEQGDQKLKLEMDVQAIPSANLVRVKFNAPDSLADNFIIVDKSTVYNYLFLTNQVTITKLNNANVGGFNFNFSQFSSFSDSFPKDKVNFKPVTTVLDATPIKGSNLEFSRVKVWVLDGSWRPQRIQYFDDKGVNPIADITVSKWEQNVGLKATDLRKLPKDAEIIKK
jgi:outer membrane lipoprotein-sorting protein